MWNTLFSPDKVGFEKLQFEYNPSRLFQPSGRIRFGTALVMLNDHGTAKQVPKE